MPEIKPAVPEFPGGEYKIESILGRGGMSVVYRARDLRRPREVAIKVLRAEVAQSIGTTRFHREIAVAASFQHPHILPLIDSGEVVDEKGRLTPYYVMPLVDGETLHQRLVREGRLPLPVILRFTREILEALQYAHAKGVIHRDIKPANILLSGGHAVVADFGISRPLSSIEELVPGEPALTMTGDVIGTPNYMSPEQALGTQVVDARSDIFSVGCVMYEMIIGDRPFDTPIPQYTNTRRRHGIFVPVKSVRPDVPEEWDEVLAKALKADPADRYASAAAFLHALSTLDEKETSSWGMLGKSPPDWMRKVAIGGLAVAGVVAAAVTSARTTSSKATITPPPAVGSNKARIAVLPIEQLTSDTLLKVVASGFQTDLIDELAQFPALTVISKNGVLQFRGNNASTDSIARALNVGSIITGDIRRIRDSVRVTVRLVDGATGVLRSTAEDSGSVRDLLTVRSSVIKSVTNFLRTVIGIEISEHERLTAQNSEAWELNARVQNIGDAEAGTVSSLSPAQRLARYAIVDSLLARAIKLDPKWPAPLLSKGSILLQRANFVEQNGLTNKGLPNDVRSNAELLRQQALSYANDALALAPDNAQAFFLRGKARFDLWRTAAPIAPEALRAAAEEDLRRAVSGRRDMALAWNELSSLLQLSGEYRASREAADSSLKSDAFLKSAPAVLARVLFASLSSGDVEGARRGCQRGQNQFPDRPDFWGCNFTIVGWTGRTAADLDSAWRLLRAAEVRDTMQLLAFASPTRRMLVASVAARAGLADSARGILRSVRASTPSDPISDYSEAYVHALLGEPEEALSLLERYVKNFPASRGQVRKSPWFASLHTNPKFQQITAAQ